MTSIAKSQITQSLPPVMAEKTEVAAISYAISRQVAYLAGKSALVRIYSSLDTAPETVLDLLAAELMTTQYNSSYTVSVKRNIVKNALLNWATNGTVAQLLRTVEEIFGDGSDISEWFDYSGKAGCFKITTDNSEISDDTVDEFKAVVNSTKRLSAKLDGVILALSVAPFRQTYGFAVQTGTTIQLIQKEE